MLAEAKNLRSQVAKLGVIALGDLFTNLGKAMDPVSEIRRQLSNQRPYSKSW